MKYKGDCVTAHIFKWGKFKLHRLFIEKMSAERNKIYEMLFWNVLAQLHLCADFFFCHQYCFCFLSLAKTIKLKVASFIHLRISAFLVCKGALL